MDPRGQVVEYEDIIFEVDGRVATITLNRPESLNGITNAMAASIERAWAVIRDDDEIHVAIIQAAGDKAFCTGVDAKGGGNWFRRTNVWNQPDPGSTLSPKLVHKVWKPVVVAVHGMCAGGAQYFLNEADIIICSDDATFFDPHANIGIMSALEPMGMLWRGMPLGDVLRWALMGTEERITADTALRLGLVTEVVPRADLHSRARAIADTIAARNTKAIQGTVRAIWESLDMLRSAALMNGMAYTHIGNEPWFRPDPLGLPTTYR